MDTVSINSFEDLLLLYETLHKYDVVDLQINISSHSQVGEIFVSGSHAIDFVAYKHKDNIKIALYLPSTVEWNNVRMIRLKRVV
jgi:hypothetical protein